MDTKAEFVTDDRGLRPFCLAMGGLERKYEFSRCRQSNAAACRQVLESRVPYIYECPAGLTEIAVPVLSGDEVAGIVITGQVRVRGRTRYRDANMAIPDRRQLRRLRQLFMQVPEFTQDQVSSCADLLFLLFNRGPFAAALLLRLGRSPSSEQSVFERMTGFVKDHFRDPDLSLSRVAAQMKVSPCFVSRAFRRELNTTFVDYVTKIRLKETERLLREQPHRSIKEIAFYIGYEDPYYFSKVFRKAYRVAPLHYRRRFLQSR